MELTVGSRTDVGPRKMNQDHHGWWPDLGLYVVADGMGGHNAGEVASHMAVEAIHGFIAESTSGDITWPFGLVPEKSLDENRLLTAVRLANRQIYSEGVRTPERSGFGSTLVSQGLPAQLGGRASLTFAPGGVSCVIECPAR